MSAYVVDPAHIDVLLSVAIHGPRDRAVRHPGDGWHPPYVNELLDDRSGPLTAEDADEAGRALLAECIESVSYRYPDDSLDELPGPRPMPRPRQYEWTDFGSFLTAIEACLAIDGYGYQSCEHPGWNTSGPFWFCHRFRCALVGAMPGYHEARWHWTAEAALARAPRVGGRSRLDR
ncbi:MAG TPA: hypothetical protein VMH33_04790 [Solirubrobacterales bacterium]|nr:hypothetical protein [Solirubrobacterales bacterium]